mmetsp:Transcript_41267/g.106787  ORF Transcript_41267/g.106787 Transcript_41267/m.106787 type:complete len:320 (+) Transcript_41267:458-1417(+)
MPSTLSAAKRLPHAGLQLVGLLLQARLRALRGLASGLGRAPGPALHAVGLLLGGVLQGALRHASARRRALRHVADAHLRVLKLVQEGVGLAPRLASTPLGLAQLLARALAKLNQHLVANLVEARGRVLQPLERVLGLRDVLVSRVLLNLRHLGLDSLQQVVELLGEILALLVHSILSPLDCATQALLSSVLALLGGVGHALHAVQRVVHVLHGLLVLALGRRQRLPRSLLQPLLQGLHRTFRRLLLGLRAGLGLVLGGSLVLCRLVLCRLGRVGCRLGPLGGREAEQDQSERCALHGSDFRSRGTGSTLEGPVAVKCLP